MATVVDYFEVKPTLMALCMRIDSQVKIVLVLANLKGQVKVSALEIPNKLNVALFV